MIKYDLNWNLERRPINLEWTAAFLRELNTCNAKHGVFFAEPVYRRFVEYREALVALHQRATASEPLTPEDVSQLVRIAVGENNRPGLATALKDGLGAYLSDHLWAGYDDQAA
jgi:hypothetical protein